MKKQFYIKSLITAVFIILFFKLNAQFYNGHQMTFGKNRVQYRDFFWTYYRYEKFDIYFYNQGNEFAKFTASVANEKLSELENFFGYSLQKRIIFILYNRQSDFKQSNIGLVTGIEEYNTGGVLKIIDNKVFLYFEEDHNNFEEQITSAVAEVLFTEMIYGGNMREKLTSSALLNIPEWYSQGLISYVSKKWNQDIENHVRDGILSGRYKKFNRLSGEDAIYAGHSLWKYIADIYGESVISNIVYMTKINKNSDSGFLFVLGLSLRDIRPDWLEYYKQRYQHDTIAKFYDEQKQIVKRPKKNRVYQNIKISPNGKYIAYSTNELGKYKIYLYNTETGKRKKIYKKGYKLQQIHDYSFPVIAWHHGSNILSFITEEAEFRVLTSYFIDTKEKKTRHLPYEKVFSFAYSHDGTQIVMSALNKGLIDIYVHSILSGTSQRITQDLADDLNPQFINKSSQILFSSNRTSDTLRNEKYVHAATSKNYDLFVYDYKNRSRKLTRIVNTPNIDEKQAVEMAHNIYSYLSDENGIVNRHIAKYDSTISYIDTTTHYRYFTAAYPLTNYPSNIIEHDINKKNLSFAEIIYKNGRNRLNYGKLKTKRKSYAGEYKDTEYRKNKIEEIAEQDSLQKIKAKEKARIKQEEEKKKEEEKKIAPPPKINPDSMLIDVRNYVFEREKYSEYYKQLNKAETFNKKKKEKDKSIYRQNYLTTFYTNYVVNQVDFGFLNTSYQPYTGGAVYFNPGFNVLFKIGTNDLFEDYKIVGGVRFAGNFDSNEYLLSWENLKKRWDKQLVFHRQAYKTDLSYYTLKTTSQQLTYLLKYPFNQVLSVRGSANFRHDKTVFLSEHYPSLLAENIYRSWGSLKIEGIFDNSRSLGINLYEGSRAKMWFEAYKQIDEKKSDLFVVGVDIRHYVPIHRNLIWATRFAASTSFGNARLIYYLGAVDNWINYSPDIETFDQTTPTNKDVNWAYQTIASNMRGFAQNVRNGNSFALINNEIRFPIFNYLANRPLNSDFFNNFQIVGFADIGTAFVGMSPYSKKNSYNHTVVRNGPITVTVDNNKSPFVGGIGFGLRSRLFGYFLRTDWAWGIENNEILPRIFYLSLSLDF